MKSFIYSFLFLLGFLYSLQSFATETEPNDTKVQANTLALNNSNTGTIGTATDVDWWKVTTNKDGKLDVTLTVSNSLYCYVQLYDNNGTTQLASNYSSTSVTISKDGLSPGTYYIYIFPFNAGQMPSYTVSNALTLAALTNDTEPNGTFSQSQTISLNSSATGHIGFYYNLKRDTTDWWKFTTTGNGMVKLKLDVSNSQYVYWQLYDGNGTTTLDAGHYTGTSSSYNVDGLAAGTYYVKVFCFYSDGFAPYTLTDSTYAPPVANDVEPNGTKATATTLPLNGSKTGQIDYYYNNLRDSTDWYKLTTNTDGRIKLTLTVYNNQYIYWQLYDNNGTTVLDGGHYTSTNSNYSVDGLAKGTYYVKVFTFYSNGFGSYTLNDSLFNAPVANDIEPNGTKATAQTFTLNSTTTGHAGYYYKLVRDTVDWYKITTTKDGSLNLALTSNNGQYVYWQLYDNDGTTVLDAGHYTSTSGNYNVDGLAANTYYLKVFCFYSNGFAPYTITNTQTQYTNANDGLSNEHAKKAVTLNANQATPGHVGFYLNGARDLVDWWKINYTGSSGSLTVTLNFEPWVSTGGTPYTYMTIYKDTLAAPIYNTFSASGTLTANLTALTQGYYYVEVYPYYSDQWSSYNLTPTWTQTNKAKIALQTATTGTDCANGSLSYKCTKSHSPYTVRLYRYGMQYGAPLAVNNTQPFTFNSLPPGKYYATVYGDGATGNAKGTSVTSVIVPVPTNTSTTKIKANKATLNWDSLSCIKYDSVYYRVQGNPTWTKIKTLTNKGSVTLTGLTALTTYEWQVAHVDTSNNQTATGSYTAIVTFTTLAMKTDESDNNNEFTMNVYPNPAATDVKVDFNCMKEGKIIIRVMDVSGKLMMVNENLAVAGFNEQSVDIRSLPAGIYTLQLIMADGPIQNQKLIKAQE